MCRILLSAIFPCHDVSLAYQTYCLKLVTSNLQHAHAMQLGWVLFQNKKMQLDVEESTPASDRTYRFHSRIAIDNYDRVITFFWLWVYHFWSSEFWSSDFWSSHGQTESEAYEPTMHKHRCAQKHPTALKDRSLVISSRWEMCQSCRSSLAGLPIVWQKDSVDFANKRFDGRNHLSIAFLQ